MEVTTLKLIEFDQIQVLKASQGDFDVNMVISVERREDLQWRLDNIQSLILHIRTSTPDIILWANTSILGWGGMLESNKIQGDWNNFANGFV